MNKNDLIDAVAERTSLAKSDAARRASAVDGGLPGNVITFTRRPACSA